MRSKRSNSRLNLSSHANVLSTASRSSWIAASNRRFGPGFDFFRLRLFSGTFGTIPRLKIVFLFLLESNAPSRLMIAPLSENPTLRDMDERYLRLSGRSTQSLVLTAATGNGARMFPLFSTIVMIFSPIGAFCRPSALGAGT